jgi:hypothetical protein
MWLVLFFCFLPRLCPIPEKKINAFCVFVRNLHTHCVKQDSVLDRKKVLGWLQHFKELYASVAAFEESEKRDICLSALVTAANSMIQFLEAKNLSDQAALFRDVILAPSLVTPATPIVSVPGGKVRRSPTMLTLSSPPSPVVVANASSAFFAPSPVMPVDGMHSPIVISSERLERRRAIEALCDRWSLSIKTAEDLRRWLQRVVVLMSTCIRKGEDINRELLSHKLLYIANEVRTVLHRVKRKESRHLIEVFIKGVDTVHCWKENRDITQEGLPRQIIVPLETVADEDDLSGVD